MQKFTRHLPIELISDPIRDMDSDPYEEGVETYRQLRGHQVILQFLVSDSYSKENILYLYCLQILSSLYRTFKAHGDEVLVLLCLQALHLHTC